MLTRAVYLIENIAPGLYLLCAFGILLSSRTLMLSRGELHAAEFELEREFARRKQANAITQTLGLIEVILAVFAVANVIAPTIRSDILPAGVPLNVAPTNAPFYTSTPGGNGKDASGGGVIDAMMLTVTAQVLQDSNSGQIIKATPTISPTPVGTIIEGMPTPVGCDTPGATLEIPANGQVIFDSITVVGTANTANFSQYKFELRGPSTGDAWTPYGGDKITPVIEKGVLGQLALSAFQPGTYQFRLVVFDSTSNLRASCLVTVELRERPPTITPPGGGK